MDKIIYGADTETLHGKPMTMQFYSEDVACDEIIWVNEKNAAKNFLAWCTARKQKALHVLYVHNLSFDLVEFLWGHHAKLASDGGDFDFKIGNWTVRGVYGTPTFCTISNGHNKRIMILDTFSYFKGSLAKGAELFCPDLPKLKAPKGLGTIQFKKNDKVFIPYAMRDAEVTYHMGKAIEKLHQEFDIRQCVSVADMASTIFRHKFLSYTIPQPTRDIIDASLLSYHGGKNNVTVKAGWFTNVHSLDISSAYPRAMWELPAFSNERLYKRYSSGCTKTVPNLGVYCISGTLRVCKWPVVFSHGFKPLSGTIDRVWVQGYELNEALRSKELRLTKIKGWYYDADKDHQAPALRAFVEHFYALKEREKDPVLRYMYKTILNSLYGKFIQTRKSNVCAYTDIDADTTVTAAELTAGGMFHPFIASAITAHPRARIHRLEHKYNAIHTATDGIMFQSKRKAKGEGKGLGSLTVEAENGTLLLVRNKCYVLYAAKKGKKTQPSSVFKGRHILKYAMHGFQGKVWDLERLIATNKRKYIVNRPHRLKEALNTNARNKRKGIKERVTPNEFVKREYTLKVGPLEVK